MNVLHYIWICIVSIIYVNADGLDVSIVYRHNYLHNLDVSVNVYSENT